MPPKQKYRWPYVKPPPLNPNPLVGPPSSSPEPDSRRRKRRKRPESSSELDEFPKVQEKVVAASDSLADDKLSDRKKKREPESKRASQGTSTKVQKGCAADQPQRESNHQGTFCAADMKRKRRRISVCKQSSVMNFSRTVRNAAT